MRRFLFDLVRVLALLLLTLTALMVVLWGGSDFVRDISAARLGVETLSTMETLVAAVMLALGLLLLIGAWRLWRGHGEAMKLTLRALTGALIFPALDVAWLQLKGYALFFSNILFLPLVFTLLMLALLHVPYMRSRVIFDRIAVRSDALSRLDDLDV